MFVLILHQHFCCLGTLLFFLLSLVVFGLVKEGLARMSSWMKLDEDLGPERGDEDFLTDDEENQAQRNNYEHSEAETESEVGRPASRTLSREGIAISVPNTNAWPQSYWYLFKHALFMFIALLILSCIVSYILGGL